MKALIEIVGDGIPDDAPNKKERKEMEDWIYESLDSGAVSVKTLWIGGNDDEPPK